MNGRCDVVSQDSTGVEAAFTKHEVTVLATGILLRSWFGDGRSVLVKNSLETAVEAFVRPLSRPRWTRKASFPVRRLKLATGTSISPSGVLTRVTSGLSTTRPATHTKERGGNSGNDEMGVTGWCTK